jgi:nucleotide-binding universal stress UspA family protein
VSTKGDRVGPATLLVGVSNPETADRLVRVSSILASERPWEILLTHVVTVASQISLTTGRSSPDVVRARDFLQRVQETARDAGVDARALVEVARSVDEGLLAAAESHDAAMILVGYSGREEHTDTGEEEFDRAMHRVARKTRADVVVAKFRGEDLGRVLVPLGLEARMRLTGLLCRALANQPGTSVAFLHVAEPGSSEAEARDRLTSRLAEAGLEALGPLEIVLAESPVEAIVAHAADRDLVILGPSGRPRFLEAIISSTGRKIAEAVPTSVLLAWGGDDDQ